MYWPVAFLPVLAVGVQCITTYRNAAYFGNWDIYARNFTPRDLPAAELTHLFYAFADISAEYGNVGLSDPWADTEMGVTGNQSNMLGGSLGQLFLLKQQHRNLKVILSIGGANYSSNFSEVAGDPFKRLSFVNTSVSLVEKYGFDGLDIDWEWPVINGSDSDPQNPYRSSILLLQELRQSLDAYGKSLSPPYHFLLTATGSASPSIISSMNIAGMDPYLDFWNILAYDYSGFWSNVTGYTANIYFGHTSGTPFCTSIAIQDYINAGIVPGKMVLGIPLYGRSFINTNGAGWVFDGVGAGTWDAGIYDLKDLPLDGAKQYEYPDIVASFSWDPIKRQFISYDTYAVMIQKAVYIINTGLGGAVFWDSSSDYEHAQQSLICGMAALLGQNDAGLEWSLNELSYPNSPFDNIRHPPVLPNENSASNHASKTGSPSIPPLIQTTSAPFGRSTTISTLMPTSIPR